MASNTHIARQIFDGTGARFILVELDLAITFCQLGLTSTSDSRADRNAANAERALEAVSRMKPRIRLSQVEENEVSAKTSELKALLEQLKKRPVSSEAGNSL